MTMTLIQTIEKQIELTQAQITTTNDNRDLAVDNLQKHLAALQTQLSAAQAAANQ